MSQPILAQFNPDVQNGITGATKPMQTINNLKSLAHQIYTSSLLGFEPEYKLDSSLSFWTAEAHLCDECASPYTEWQVDDSGHMIPVHSTQINGEVNAEWAYTAGDSESCLCDRCRKPTNGYQVIEFTIEVPSDCIITKEEESTMIYEIPNTHPILPIQTDTRKPITLQDLIKVAEESNDEAKVGLVRVYIANRNGMMSAKTWSGFKLAKEMLAASKLQLQNAYPIKITEDLSRCSFLSRWSSVQSGNKRMTGIRADGAWITPEIIELKSAKIAARPNASKPNKQYGLGRDGVVYHPAEKYNWCMGKSNAAGLDTEDRQQWIARANAYRKLAGELGVADDQVFEFGVSCQEARERGENPITKEVVDALLGIAAQE